MNTWMSTSSRNSCWTICFAFVALLRILVGYQPHSGQDNYQGPNRNDSNRNTNPHQPYGGDYEAQRHWMEITYHLPSIGQWYYYDTQYWGLDYPPLSAYHSYLCGYICHNIFHLHEAIALDTSRGYEDPIHKAYMRSTVLISDLLVYGTAIWILATSVSATAAIDTRQASSSSSVSTLSVWVFIYCMIQPSILLIDHGHFQYNTVALGFSLWSIYYITLQSPGSYSNMKYCMIGSFFFCCALSFKQMTLYYAPAIFFYLLGRCFAPDVTRITTTNSTSQVRFPANKYFTVLYRLALLGITVITTFTMIWWPFLVYKQDMNDPSTTADRMRHMFQRIIPIQRGLFEGKVSNLWCALSVAPFRIRQRIPISYQPIAALLVTLILLIPSSVYMFILGSRHISCNKKFINTKINVETDYHRHQLLWGVTNSALAFFLASFQVHEKSLLLALAPCSILIMYTNIGTKNGDTKFIHWFSIVTTWTLWPLLQIDRLQTAYACTIFIFLAVIGLYNEYCAMLDTHTITTTQSGICNQGFFDYYAKYHFDWIPTISYLTMIVLHIAEYIVIVPDHLPDLFAVLWSIVGCGFCCLAYIISCWNMVHFSSPSYKFITSEDNRIIQNTDVGKNKVL